MSHKLTVTMGGEASAPVVDYTPVVQVFDAGEGPAGLIEMGMSFADGSASEGTFNVDDDAGEIPRSDDTRNLAAKNVVLWTEDASGAEIWLSRGRIANKDVGRNEDYPIADARQFSVQTNDANVDLKQLNLREPWVRPAESDYDRLVALQAYTLNGASSTAPAWRRTTVITVDSAHLAPNTNTVVMPAKTYEVGTSIDEIVADCADTAGKTWGVEIHHDGGSHLCLQYILADDHTTYLSPVKVSDVLSEIDTDSLTAPVVLPIWDQGAATVESGQEDPISALILKYGSGDKFVIAEDTSKIAGYDYAVDVYNDDLSVTVGQATARANAILGFRSKEHLTHQVTIILKDTQVHLIGAGMSLRVKSAAMMGGQYLHTEQTRRIAQCKFEPRSPRVGSVEGTYFVHLQLDRTFRSPFGRGKAQPAATGPTPPTPGTPGSSVTYEHYTWDGTGNSPTANTEEPINHLAPGAGHSEWYSVPGGGVIVSPGLNGTGYKHGVNHDNGESVAIAAGTTFTWSWWWSAFNDPVYFYLTYHNDAGSVIAGPTLVATATGADHQLSFSDTVPAGATWMSLQGMTATSGGVQATYYVDEGLITVDVPAVPGDDPPPASDDSTGDIGDPTTGCYATCDHKHPAQTAAVTPVTDSAGYFTGTDVEAVLAELQDNIDGVSSGVTDHGALTGLLDDDHTQYQKESEKGAVSGYAPLDASGDIEFARLPVGTTPGTVSEGNHTHSNLSGGGLQLAVRDGTNPMEYVYLDGTTDPAYLDRSAGGAEAAVAAHEHTSYLRGESDKTYRWVAGVLEYSAGTWALVAGNHSSIHVNSVTQDSTNDYIEVNFDTATKVIRAFATADEQFVVEGYMVGSTSFLDKIRIAISRDSNGDGTWARIDPATAPPTGANIWFDAVLEV